MRRVSCLRMVCHSSDIITAGAHGYMPMLCRPEALSVVVPSVYTRQLLRLSPKQAGSGLQDKPCPNRLGSVLTIVVAVPAAVEAAEEAGTIAR